MPARTRATTRRAVLLAFGAVLGKFDAVKASGAQLTVDLGQWNALVFFHRGKRVTIPVSEVFDALVNGDSRNYE